MSRYSRQLFPFCTLVLIFALCSVLAPEHFLSVRNLLNILRGASVTGIAAVGMTFVVIIAGIHKLVMPVVGIHPPQIDCFHRLTS